MSTPIENNTEGLEEILRTVNELPAAGGGSGSPLEIPVIDCTALGFPNLTAPPYGQTVSISQATYNELKTKLEFGFVKLYFMFGGTPLTIGCLTGVYPATGNPAYVALSFDVARMVYAFNISNNGGTYVASLSIGS